MALETLTQQFIPSMHAIQTLSLLLALINALIHVLFAGAVAKDAGRITKLQNRPALVSATTWAFATLIGGVFVAAIYWFIHHSTLTRPSVSSKNMSS